MNQIKLRKCNACGEWFNTTQSVMFEHYKLKHEFIINKTFVIAELVMKRELLLFKAKLAPFPECLTFTLAAVSADSQLQMVISQSDKQNKGDSYVVGVSI